MKFLEEIRAAGADPEKLEDLYQSACEARLVEAFHAALGAAYPETGATNQSGLHWDMVCDLRQGGRIYVDGKLISQDGRFLDPTWPQP